MSSSNQTMEVDALIVGAGFGGVHMLNNLRKLGLSAKIFEAGDDLGGIWYWCCYPGARVDSDLPIYQLTSDELWKDWNWTEKFPGWAELREYFHYLDKKLDLTRDVVFKSRVVSANWDSATDKWTIRTEDGKIAIARFLLLCTGIGSKPYVPAFKGLDTFKGISYHTARWPQSGVDFKGKKVGVIGTGATAVQVIQEVAPVSDHLTVFQRTPNLALPMNQGKVNKEYQDKWKSTYPIIFRRRFQTFSGFSYDINPKKTFDASPEERHLFWESLWEEGGFRYWLANYSDMFNDQAANDEAYAFWRDKTRARIHDPTLKDKLAPMVAPHPFGTKRPSLEQTYYEVYNQSNVTLVDINETPLVEITEKGVKTEDGKEHQFDILVLATGFDMVSGGITQIDIRGTDGVPIGEKWGTEGVHTYLGMSCATYPNMFFLYGPHGPTSFCNGPSCAELQGNWITECIQYMRDKSLTRMEATRKAEKEWRTLVFELSATGLWNKAKSWYMGANIPGKPIEPLNFTGGVVYYKKRCDDAAHKGYEGFETGTIKT